MNDTILPLDTVIMAGGRGSRLRPLTEFTPKPLLEISDKPIIEHQLDHLSSFGINNIWICLNYLGNQIEAYFNNNKRQYSNLEFIWEDHPLGSIGGISNIHNFQHDSILIMNSDVLTDIDYAKFFTWFIEADVDMAVVTIPYRVDVPYAVMELKDNQIINFKEKPTYSYPSNGGIYLIKREITEEIPADCYYDATDLLEKLIDDGKKVNSYQHTGFWLDVGRHEDLMKAKKELGNLRWVEK